VNWLKTWLKPSAPANSDAMNWAEQWLNRSQWFKDKYLKERYLVAEAVLHALSDPSPRVDLPLPYADMDEFIRALLDFEGYGEKLKEGFSSSISYLQGYKITDAIMPYAKVSYDLVYFNTEENHISSGFAHGVGFGGGVKFAVSEHLELGVEYTRMNLEGDSDIKIKGDNIALNLGYRF